MQGELTDKAWRVQLFGEPHASFGGTKATFPSVRRATLLFIRLASSSRRIWSRDELCEILWPDEYVDVARDRLRQTLALLNKSLRETGGPSPLLSTKTTLALDHENVEIDANLFSRSLLVARTTSDTQSRINAFEKAMTFAKAPFAEGYLEEWVRQIRSTFAHDLHSARLELANLFWASDQVESAIEILRVATFERPLDEQAAIALLKAYRKDGREAEAQAWAQQYQSRLKSTVGLQPSQALAKEIRRVEEPKRNDDDEVVRTTSLWLDVPRPLTRFFGREEELAWLASTVSDPAHRLVTVTGLGGSGKTRLVSEYLQTASSSWGSTLMVGLAERASVKQVVEALAQGFGFHAQSERVLEDQVIGRLQQGEVLLILDNCEHLCPDLSGLVAKLLDRCPTLKVLATSRVLLDLAGERELALAPLAVPGDRQSENDQLPAMQMLIERVRSVRHDIQLSESDWGILSEICKSVDGIPLALEMVGARARVLSLSQILENLKSGLDFLSTNLSNVPDRHRAMRNALEGSFSDLSYELRDVLIELSVLLGSWTVEAAEAITGHADVWLSIDDLRSRSLIVAESQGHEVRFRMLEVVRQFSQEMAEAGQIEAAIQRHMRYFGEYAVELNSRRIQQDGPEVMIQFLRSLPNFRLATENAFKAGKRAIQQISELTTYLAIFYEDSGHIDEIATSLKRVIDEGLTVQERRPFAIHFYCQALCVQVDLVGINRMIPVVLGTLEDELDAKLRGNVLSGLSYMAWIADRKDVSYRLVDHWERLLRDNSIPRLRNIYRANFANTLHHIGRSREAISLNESILREEESNKEQRLVGDVYVNLARIHRELGDPRKGLTLAVQAVNCCFAVHNKYLTLEAIQEVLSCLVLCDLSHDDLVAGARLLGFVESRREKLGAVIMPYQVAGFDVAHQVLHGYCATQMRSLMQDGSALTESEILNLLQGISG